MEKGSNSGLFVNDGSFMERFKQLEKDSSSQVTSSVPPKPGGILGKRPLMPSGKLAFSLKQKSKIAVTPVKLGTDEDEGEDDGFGAMKETSKRQMLGPPDPTELTPLQAPSPPSDPAMRKVAEKLANFVAKNGRPYEHITRQRNPGDTPFKFLFDTCCPDYKYYEYRLLEEEKIIAQTKQSQTSHTVTPSGTTSRSPIIIQRGSLQQHSDYQTPASALYGNDEDSASVGRAHAYGASSGPPSSDPIAMMEYYMKRAAQEERKRPPKQSKDEMPPPASLQAPVKKGHHMGDYIPPEELEKFFASCSDASSQKSSREASEKAKIQADNIGHKLLSKMGWREGEGLGSDRRGRADPVMSGDVKKDHLGVGAQKPGEVNPEDDIYEQYKKRMMLGYRYRPNPLNNPRKSYY